MSNKEIQEQRMKGYFIQATKEILKGEGLKSISVRNISERAGYSYATLYNYFKDVKDLIFECVVDFQDECETFIKSETKKYEPGLIKIKAITKAYIKYFIQYPGIYELFYIEKTTDLAHKQPTVKLIHNFLNKLCEEEWQYCLNNKILNSAEASVMKETLHYAVIGALIIYINRRQPATYKEFSIIVESQLNYILNLA
ncbi:MAG: TetR/AcrR family transcriptional regulator [Bacteroidetes bacterium]|nr:TetR/AcrR family transcriptional regulator [Bacteroidota bacterium]